MSPSRLTSRLSMKILPALGRSSSPMRLSRVLLPEPDGPISAANSPRCRARSIPCSTSISTGVPTPYDLHTLSSRSVSAGFISATDRQHRVDFDDEQGGAVRVPGHAAPDEQEAPAQRGAHHGAGKPHDAALDEKQAQHLRA